MNPTEREEIIRRLKDQHIGQAPVQFSPDQVRKMLVEVLQRPEKRFRVEFDCGNPVGRQCDSTSCARKGRPMGMYLIDHNGIEYSLNIGFMRVSEMSGLAELLNSL